jgi:predicted nucleotidyltransferase
MADNKQQTAVEWQFEQLFNSFEKFNNGEYTFDEYLKSNLEIREQAKEMEKEQIEEAFANGVDDEYEWHINNVPRKNSETYYNETYGGGEQ